MTVVAPGIWETLVPIQPDMNPGHIHSVLTHHALTLGFARTTAPVGEKPTARLQFRAMGERCLVRGALAPDETPHPSLRPVTIPDGNQVRVSAIISYTRREQRFPVTDRDAIHARLMRDLSEVGTILDLCLGTPASDQCEKPGGARFPIWTTPASARLAVQNPRALSQLAAVGIGRHHAFGAGLTLITNAT